MGNETEKKQVRKESSQMQIAPPQSDAKPGNAPSLDNTWSPATSIQTEIFRTLSGAFRFWSRSPCVRVPVAWDECGALILDRVNYRTGIREGGTILHECHRTATFSFEWHLSKLVITFYSKIRQK